jgi:death on curing protein
LIRLSLFDHRPITITHKMRRGTWTSDSLSQPYFSRLRGIRTGFQVIGCNNV